MSGWCTIESDPAVFSEMIEKFGVEGLDVEELLSVDEESLAALGTGTHGLILLFKWKPSASSEASVQVPSSDVYFARQVVQNACATQAIINILLNRSETLALGSTLTEFKQMTAFMSPQQRGEMIGDNETLRNVHNSFTRTSVFAFEDRAAKGDDDDVYHFVGYTFAHGGVWELDGLQEAPIFHGAASEITWKNTAAAAIQKRINSINAADTSGTGQGISFSLLAIVDDRLTKLRAELASTRKDELPTGDLEDQIVMLQQRRDAGRLENERRKHNYIPALVALLRGLAQKGKLDFLVEQNQKAVLDRKARRKEHK